MPFTAVARTEYFADDLAEIIDLPSSFRGQKVVFMPISVPQIKVRKSVMDLPKINTGKSVQEIIDWVREDKI